VLNVTLLTARRLVLAFSKRAPTPLRIRLGGGERAEEGMPVEKRVGQIGELPKLPQARIWRPTEEQFHSDFYAYIRMIQPEAHK
jgi:hypothetical protein